MGRSTSGPFGLFNFFAIYHRRRLLLLLVVMTLVFSVLLLWWTDELQFIGHDTAITTAVVTVTKMRPLGKGLYIQVVTYEYRHNGDTYTGTFEAGKPLGKQELGKQVKIKFSIKEPCRSKRL